MAQDNKDTCPACRADGLRVSKVNGGTQVEVPQDYAFARHGGLGPQIQRAMTHANSAGNSTPAHSTHASHTARLSAESNVDQPLARADADIDPRFALLHPDFTPDVLQPRSPDAIVAETLPHSCGVFSRWPSDMEVNGNSLPASTGAHLAAANAGGTSPWNYLELSGSIRVPSDLGENARKDYDKLPDEVKKFLREQGLPEGVDKDSDQQSLIHLIYLIFRNAKGNRIPLGKGVGLDQRPPGTRYRSPAANAPPEQCGYRRLFNTSQLRDAID